MDETEVGTSISPPPPHRRDTINIDTGGTDGAVDEVADDVPLSLADPIAALALGAVADSWDAFYHEGDTEGGIFTDLWAPTHPAGANCLQANLLIYRIRERLSTF